MNRLSGGELARIAERKAVEVRPPSFAELAAAAAPTTLKPPDRPPAYRRQKRARDRVLNQHARKAWESDAKRRARALEKERKHLEEHKRRYRARGRTDDDTPPAFPLALRISSDAQMHDPHGAHSRRALDTLSPAHKAMLRRAALGEGLEGECLRDLSGERARGLIAFGVALIQMSAPTGSHGQWSRETRGITLGAVGSLIQGARARPVHRNTISGYHRGGDPAELADADLGYVQALERVGLIKAQRLPWERCEPFECWTKPAGPDGGTIIVTTNRYQIANANPFNGNLPEAIRLMLAELAARADLEDELRLRPTLAARRAAARAAPAPVEAPPPDG